MQLHAITEQLKRSPTASIRSTSTAVSADLLRVHRLTGTLLSIQVYIRFRARCRCRRPVQMVVVEIRLLPSLYGVSHSISPRRLPMLYTTSTFTVQGRSRTAVNVKHKHQRIERPVSTVVKCGLTRPRTNDASSKHHLLCSRAPRSSFRRHLSTTVSIR